MSTGPDGIPVAGARVADLLAAIGSDPGPPAASTAAALAVALAAALTRMAAEGMDEAPRVTARATVLERRGARLADYAALAYADARAALARRGDGPPSEERDAALGAALDDAAAVPELIARAAAEAAELAAETAERAAPDLRVDATCAALLAEAAARAAVGLVAVNLVTTPGSPRLERAREAAATATRAARRAEADRG